MFYILFYSISMTINWIDYVILYNLKHHKQNLIFNTSSITMSSLSDRKVHDISHVSSLKEGGQDEKEDESLSIQQRVEGFFNDSFGRWGIFISENPCKVFWLSMLVFILLAGGMS